MSGRIAFWATLGLAAAVGITSVAIPVATIQPYLEQSTSMQNTLVPGDRIYVAPGSSVRRGDVVVLRVPVSQSRARGLFVKRVIGLPGDRVACCDARGRVTVDGKPLDETYVYPGDPPSRIGFSVTLGPGRIWVMGDHRTISIDSREWGPVPASGVVGRVILVSRGTRLVWLRTPQTFVSDGLAPADTRDEVYVWLALLAAASAVALLALSGVGIIRSGIRRRRRRRAAAGVSISPEP